MTTILIIIASILNYISVTSDAKADASMIGGKMNYKYDGLQFIVILNIILLFYVNEAQMLLIFAQYFAFRAGLFNPTINKARNLDITYLGSNWFDKIHYWAAKLENRKYMPIVKGFPALSFLYFIYFSIGLSLPIIAIFRF